MNYIAFSILAAVSFAISIIVGKFVSKKRIENADSLFVLSLLTLLSVGIFIPLIVPIYITKTAILPVILYSATYILGFYLYIKALFLVDASVIGPILQFQAGFLVILAALFLGEGYSLPTYLWLAALIFGAILVSMSEKLRLSDFFQKGVLLLIGTQLLHAISNLFVGISLKTISFWSVMFFNGVGIALTALLFSLIKKPKLKYPAPTIRLLVARGAFSVMGAAALFRAFQENLSISGVIGLMAAPIVFVISILASVFYPKLLEHHSARVYAVRGVGLLIILFGAIKLTLGQ